MTLSRDTEFIKALAVGVAKRSQVEDKFNAIINLNYYKLTFLNWKNLDFLENMFLKVN